MVDRLAIWKASCDRGSPDKKKNPESYMFIREYLIRATLFQFSCV